MYHKPQDSVSCIYCISYNKYGSSNIPHTMESVEVLAQVVSKVTFKGIPYPCMVMFKPA